MLLQLLSPSGKSLLTRLSLDTAKDPRISIFVCYRTSSQVKVLTTSFAHHGVRCSSPISYHIHQLCSTSSFSYMVFSEESLGKNSVVVDVHFDAYALMFKRYTMYIAGMVVLDTIIFIMVVQVPLDVPAPSTEHRLSPTDWSAANDLRSGEVVSALYWLRCLTVLRVVGKTGDVCRIDDTRRKSPSLTFTTLDIPRPLYVFH